MSFVNGEQRNRRPPKRVEKRTAAEAFRGDVNELVFAVRQPPDAVLLLRERERAIDERSGDAASFQCVHLILHQRDEWADDHGDAFEHQRGQLVTKRFPAARGHDDQRVVARENRGDDFLLGIEKFAETEVLFQQQVRVGHRRRRFRCEYTSVKS